MNNTYLAHHGIRGMKWGIRRFENFMGRLTPAGKKRYGKTYKEKRNRIKEFINNRKAKRYDRRSNKMEYKIDSTKLKTLAKAGLTAAATYKLYKNPKTRKLASKAAIGGAALTALTAAKIPGYRRKQKRYERKAERLRNNTRNKRTSKLRTAAKVAGTAALAGGAAYALHKTGALKKSSNLIQNKHDIKLLNAPKAIKNSQSHAASRAVINANRKFTQNRKQQDRYKDLISNIQSKAGSTVKTATKTAVKRATPIVKDQAYKISSKAKKKAVDNVKKTFTKNIDTDDPDNWKQLYRNTKEVITKGKHYYNIAKVAKNVDPMAAAAMVTPDIIDATNTMLKNGNESWRKFQNSRKRKDS